MIKPVKDNNVSFKSGPWYANAITYATRLDSLGPIIALETTVTGGRTIHAYQRGGKEECRERAIEETTGAVVWLFGVKLLNSLGDKLLKHLYGGNFDVGSDKILRTPFENFMKKNSDKSFAKNTKQVAAVKAAKVLTSVLIADAFIGLVVPKLNQKLTRTLIERDKEKARIKAAQNQSDDNKSSKDGNVSFKGGGFAAINTFTNAIENTNIGKLLSTDAGLISGRMYSARNSDERREIAIRDIGSIYFYMFASAHVGNLINKISTGSFRRLNPDSANILNEYLLKMVEANGGELSAEQFEKLALGKNSTDIKLPEDIKFEVGELSAFDKMFNKNKEPLKVIKVSELRGKFDSKVLERIEAMSKLQPLRQGEAVVTKQQIIDALNIAEVNNPELLDKVFTKYSGGASKDEFKYVSNDSLYKIKSDMEAYIKNLCKKAKDGKITKDFLNKAKNKNLLMCGINFAAGFSVAAIFLSTLIPKFQYWVTKKKTGMDAFPGTYGLIDNNDKS